MTAILIILPSALFSLVAAILVDHWWGSRRAMATARSRASTLPSDPVPPEAARRFLATLGDGEWEVAVGRVLVRREVRDHEDGHSEGLPRHSIIYGWRDQRGTLRLEELQRAVKNGRLKTRMLAPLWTDAPFLVAFEASSPRHHLAEVSPAALARVDPGAPAAGGAPRAGEFLLFSLMTSSGASPLCAIEMAPGERCVIGRAPECDVVVPSESPVRRIPGRGPAVNVLSRMHAAVSLSEGQYRIEDLGTSAGTFSQRDQERITGHHQVHSGDEFSMGNVVLKIEILPRPPDAAAEPARRLPPIRRPRAS